MRPILMKGHERPLTFLKYNRDGDLLFSCAKDLSPTVWFADNGERLGTYRGHNGAVWCCDVSRDSMLLITGSADQTAKLWNVQTGAQLFTFNFDSPTRAVDFGVGDKLAVITTDPFMELPSAIHIKRISRDPSEPCFVLLSASLLPAPATPLHLNMSRVAALDSSFPPSDSSLSSSLCNFFFSLISSASIIVSSRANPEGPQGRINRAVWGPLNKTIVSAGEDAVIRIWDSETGKLLKESDKEIGHKKTITSLSKSADGSHFLTGSLDKSAKLWDTRSLSLIKTYVTERPVNAVAMSPLLDHVVLGGGQDASAVTTTDHRAGNFSSGGEDGYVRLHHFDQDYFNIRI
ncbi:hypothetical protein RHGRI_033031 [Rhododendron griersonianum]|uniref:Serine-threonine kinase receptor-associated protein n=1 Tax=Rhododendron griersonianum TaxID=479676 RepID=A0AAV6I0W0_9ERIC|nr:hypothetical protein RHGRI_033031 [Rhododendron griersonianum]